MQWTRPLLVLLMDDVFVSFELSGKLRDARLVLLDEVIFECFMVILVVQSYVKRCYKQAPAE